MNDGDFNRLDFKNFENGGNVFRYTQKLTVRNVKRKTKRKRERKKLIKVGLFYKKCQLMAQTEATKVTRRNVDFN